MNFKIDNSIDFLDLFIDLKVEKGDIVIDATAGNGYDTVKLSKKVGEFGKVYSFDIQEEAILRTKNLLEKKLSSSNVKLIKDSHGNLDKYIKEKVNFAVFNLGYLPRGNKNITTKGYEVIKAIESILTILKPKGMIGIVSYIGHPEGKIENKEILDFISSLEQKSYNVLEIEYINQINNPPKLYIIEKRDEQ